MCATCFAQGAVYVVPALGGLQVMAARARAKRRRDFEADGVEPGADPGPETDDERSAAWSS